LVRALRGDLDWIVARAMAKEREERYASASELAADVRRHLARRPVNAAPASALYRFGKLVRRHPATSAALAALGLLALVSYLVIAWLYVRATDAEEQARLQAAHAREIADYLALGLED